MVSLCFMACREFACRIVFGGPGENNQRIFCKTGVGVSFCWMDALEGDKRFFREIGLVLRGLDAWSEKGAVFRSGGLQSRDYDNKSLQRARSRADELNVGLLDFGRDETFKEFENRTIGTGQNSRTIFPAKRTSFSRETTSDWTTGHSNPGNQNGQIGHPRSDEKPGQNGNRTFGPACRDKLDVQSKNWM